jgi:hypothetical protein
MRPISATGLTMPQPDGMWVSDTNATSSLMVAAIHSRSRSPEGVVGMTSMTHPVRSRRANSAIRLPAYS